MTTDLIFGFLVIVAIIFGASQFVRMLSSTQGVSTSAYIFTWTSVALNLYLAIKAHRVRSSRVTYQAATIQFLGLMIYTAFVILVIAKGNNIWDGRDNVTTGLVLVGVIVIILVSRRTMLTWKDPIVKGFLSLFFKSAPQVVMAFKVLAVGGNGLSGIMMITFHVLTLTRIIQITFAIREEGMDRNRRGLMISEIGNEVSWLMVTIAWLIS